MLELHRPLGQDIRRRPARARRGLARPASLLGGLLAVALSAASALHQALPERAAPESAARLGPAVPDVVAPASAVASGGGTPPVAVNPATAPTIIRASAAGGVTVDGPDGQRLDAIETGGIRVFDPGSLRQPARFAHVPDAALLEETSFGALPVRAGDGRRPMDVYAGPSSGALGTRIAIVVGGLGISQTGTQEAIRALPAGVTLAFAASGNSLDRWSSEARRAGHEILVQAPMEPFGYPEVSPAEHTLLAADAAAGRLDDFDRALGRLTNYVGVMNFMGARVSSDASAMEPLLTEIGRRGLLFFDDGSSARSLAGDVATAGGVPFAQADRLLDGTRDPASVARELDALERTARAKGSAIGVASAFGSSVTAIAAWIGEAEARGIEIVPVSALAVDPERN